MLVPYIEINQPIGTFYITKLIPETILACTKVNRRSESCIGIQRSLDNKKVNQIENYSDDPDATFPTPIIIAVDSKKVDIKGNNIEFSDKSIIGEIIDGQHRIEGLRNSNNRFKFELPVVFMFDLTSEEKAYVFSVINSNQKPVSKSLIYDLFDLSDKRSPYRTAHEIARGLNTDKESAFYGKLKMLGKKEGKESSLSQGTFVYHLLKCISKNPDKDSIDIKNKKELTDDISLPLRYYFIKNKDEIIYKIIRNYFNAIARVFSNDWNNSEDFILARSTGYGALMRVFPYVYKIGDKRNTLKEEFFFEIFNSIKDDFYTKYKFTSDVFSSNEQEQNRLSKIIIELIKENGAF
ncbi:DGQHR domain-containing protein [uncultured Clostridium sp.]|uniref:DGQHR domain-containing protein n=1 Tax=uncultured Clostridium sp. TaxID=59620 RepID=UPI0025DFF42D|nr:DGQHR domain-containing protein [uncultured Clostridium sp.]